MENKKKKKIAILLTVLGILIMVGSFVAMFIVLFTFENFDTITVIIPTMVGFFIGFALLLTSTVINTKIKNAQFKATAKDSLLEENNSNIPSEIVQKSVQTTATNNIDNVTKTYPAEVADKATILHTWATIVLFIISLITTVLLFTKGFDLWMLVLITLIIAGFAFIVIDFKKFETSQTQVDKWNDKGKMYAPQSSVPYIEMTIEKANKEFKNKFFFWMTKNKACITKAVTSILSSAVILIIVLASVFTGFGAVINPVGEYTYDYSNKSGYGANCYVTIVINEDNTYKEITYYYGNISKTETGIWEKSGSSLYVYAQKIYDDHGTLTWTLNPNDTYPEQTNYVIGLGKITSSNTDWIKK